MNPIDVPLFGTLSISAALVMASFTFAISVAAGRGRPQLLSAARWGTYSTAAFVAVATLLLAYAFQTHDFRIRYVAHYSDRSMEWYYLLAALWGGQDGSLLWWSFLLSGWMVATTAWMRGRFVELQPWVLATLMSILIFFFVLMLFAANPFATTPSMSPPDGKGLNPLLQNYWMIIHPPSLYMGFIGWSIPFAFCIAALMTGRLHDEWILASRRWMLAAWLFLSIGLALGMLWSYEELGWGGYWAWDPVENASFMPWLVGTAYLHSVLVQERYGMLKVWNVYLMCLTFFMTIFGTFLTRAGLISSVHSFAKSDIGVYFLGYMVALVIVCFGLIGWRTPELRSVHKVQSLASREFMFLLNNWILLAIMFLVLALTTAPLITELYMGEEVVVGPPVYNRFMVPFGLVLLVLAGVGPLVSWRKATGRNLLEAFIGPTLLGAIVAVVHWLAGPSLGFAAWVDTQPIYDTQTGEVLRTVFGASPVLASFSCAFVLGSIVQEFLRGTATRMRNKGEHPLLALVMLVAKARRRYGGYIVHLGIVMMFIGFAGSCYDVERESSGIRPGATLEVGTGGLLRGVYTVRYDGARTTEDPNKHALFADVTLLNEDGDVLGQLHPAKFIYRKSPESPTTEVAIRSRLLEDMYVILSTVDPRSQTASLRVIVRPLVLWIWLGTLVLIFGTLIAMLPTIREILGEDRAVSSPKQRRAVAGAVAVLFALVGSLGSAGEASAQDSSSLHAGHVEIDNPEERAFFERLLCMCGDCQRLSLATCGCSWADDMREEVRDQLARGKTEGEIEGEYRERFGARGLSIPPDEGVTRLTWALPVAGAVIAFGLVGFVGWRWRSGAADAGGAGTDEPPAGAASDADREAYDEAIDDELARLDGEEG